MKRTYSAHSYLKMSTASLKRPPDDAAPVAATTATDAAATVNNKDIMDTSGSGDDYSNNFVYMHLSCYGEHKKAVSSVSWAPAAYTPRPLCASASADSTVQVWSVYEDVNSDIIPKGPLFPILSCLGHSRGINQVKWHPTSPLLATASDDKSLRVWDALTGDALVELRGHDNFAFGVDAWQSLLVSASFDETVKLWDVRTGNCIRTLPAHSDPVTAVAFNRDGTCIVSASHDGLVRVWDVATGASLKTLFAPGNPPVAHALYSPNGHYLLVGTLDSTLRLWSVAPRQDPIKTFTAPSSFAITKYSIVSDFTHDGNIIAGSETGDVTLWHLQSQKVLQVLKENASPSFHNNNDASTSNANTNTNASSNPIISNNENEVDNKSNADNKSNKPVLAVSSHRTLPFVASGGCANEKSVQFFHGVTNDEYQQQLQQSDASVNQQQQARQYGKKKQKT